MSTEATSTAHNSTYWKSLNELAQNEEYKKFVEREFPENATELTDKVSRRGFLRIMGASIALAGFAACRRPVQKILPYTKQPEDMIQGEAMFYASAMPFQDVLTGLVVETHEGRPTKIEGNKEHSGSLGSTSLYEQAAVLGLYDPDRSQSVLKDGSKASWSDFSSFSAQHFANTDRNILFISEASSSPTYNRIKEQALRRFGNADWVTYEPFSEDNALEGVRLATGRRARTYYHIDKANVMVALDDDFMNPAENKNNVEYIKQWSKARKVRSTDDGMIRLSVVESNFSLTGSNADNRLRLKSSEIETFIYALAAKLSSNVRGLEAFRSFSASFSGDTQRINNWIDQVAAELLAHRGESLLTVGRDHSPEAHAAVTAINMALNNDGSTVTYHDLPYKDDQNDREAFADAVSNLNDGQYDTVVLVGTNPVFTAAADLNFSESLSKAETTIHLSEYVDETSSNVNWHVNRASFLESWGDGFSYNGTRSVIQPMIRPLFDGKSDIEFLNVIATGNDATGYNLVQETWKSYYRSGFNKRWRKILHDGVDTDGHFRGLNLSLRSRFDRSMQSALKAATSPSNGVEVVVRADSKVFDGRYANNGWLQELPEPMTKITWDNVALLSPKTAKDLGVPEPTRLGEGEAPLIDLSVNGQKVTIPAWILPGHADNSITVTAGQGRSKAGRVGNDTGTNTFGLRTTSAPFYATGAKVSATGEMYEIACTQDHQSMEGRSLIREADLETYRENPDFATYESAYNAELPGKKLAHELGQEHPPALFDPAPYPDYEPQWGMSIDLNACIGCGSCTIACQAENNIPVIGKREVRRGREMHWIRTDRYFEGDSENPKAIHQPVPCMHCELAPCEQVCPVAATTHSEDGMNQMTYNRCIGTRYCANNCPYKVRRFNFFNYSKEYLTTGDDPDIIQMAMNPDVTVRFRGVMEKCTFCVQRVNKAKIEAKKETGHPKPEDGAVETACQQACPTDAISFGDLMDKNSKVMADKSNERSYLLLEELNTRPRVSYMAKLRNPNQKLA
ncbi:MAG: TAT-variant-translocated molybdopterin oxidoreductase [Bacteroidota bacterium]